MRLTVLIFVGHYLPGVRAGGPIRTIENLVQILGDEFEFKIVTRDRDLGCSYRYPEVSENEWVRVGKADVLYCDAAEFSWVRLLTVLRNVKYDVLYLNSFFDYCFTIRCLVLRYVRLFPACPTLLAPRGEFSLEALSNGRMKKRAYIFVGRFLGVFKGVKWQASTEVEAIDVSHALHLHEIERRWSIAVAPDLVVASCSNSEVKEVFRETGGALRVCFLSRIVRIKNLDYAINILSDVAVEVEFSIYGPVEDADYWLECQALLSSLPRNIKFSYRGEVENSRVKEVIGSNDLFFVPSKSENFGHVFVESLLAGVPILVSDNTPWRNLESRNLGWDFPLSEPKKFVSAIECFSRYDCGLRSHVRDRCLDYGRAVACDVGAIENNRKLFGGARLD